MAPIVSIVGKSNSGKTTLLEKLIPLLSQRGYRVGTIKHHAHADFEIDYPGKDTWRHYQAGAEAVLISAPGKLALIERGPSDVSPLKELAGRFTNVDLILTEGFMRDSAPKIEVVRAARSKELLCTQDELSAIVTDLPLKLSVPRFDLDEVEALADFIEAKFLRQS
ncbi:MAG TPA: molybdopterin-guanine dinucleotide biosynthesis protein B [Anaerolineae bacterium]|nr:molybdopterin-guanine dinucleotide biosynthesis protein B [Anaerolineae bacterium]HMR68077.1 molybdopterin-guanine dinucleotide biosynthesis protein B [Anaerolineae bacterium]